MSKFFNNKCHPIYVEFFALFGAIFGPKIRLIAVDLDIAEDTKQFFSDNDIIYFETVLDLEV